MHHPEKAIGEEYGFKQGLAKMLGEIYEHNGTTIASAIDTIDYYIKSERQKAYEAGRKKGIIEESISCEEHCKLAYDKGKKGEPLYFEEIVQEVARTSASLE